MQEQTRSIARARATERVRKVYARMARHFDRRVGRFERLFLPDGRRWACSKARGDTLEIAVGTGLNLPHYPPEVRLTAVDLSPEMLGIARRRAGELGRDVDLRPGDAQALDLPEAAFDTVVCTLSLCSIPDDRAAVAEARRVLRPGGRFVLVEHVRSTNPVVRAVQRLIDPLVRWLEADHVLREPLEHLRAEGFEVEVVERSRWGVIERLVARKPPSS